MTAPGERTRSTELEEALAYIDHENGGTEMEKFIAKEYRRLEAELESSKTYSGQLVDCLDARDNRILEMESALSKLQADVAALVKERDDLKVYHARAEQRAIGAEDGCQSFKKIYLEAESKLKAMEAILKGLLDNDGNNGVWDAVKYWDFRAQADVALAPARVEEKNG